MSGAVPRAGEAGGGSADPPDAETDFHPLAALSCHERSIRLNHLVSLGTQRAFDSFHRRQREDLERDSDRRWREQERLRNWRVRRASGRLFFRKSERDKGIIEDIVTQRNGRGHLRPTGQATSEGRRSRPMTTRSSRGRSRAFSTGGADPSQRRFFKRVFV
jgi:hypothetical protein